MSRRDERADQRETAARNALTAAGIPDAEPYPAEAVDAREASLRTGGRSLHTPERIARLAAERDEARRLHSAAEAHWSTYRNELRARLAQVERERDEARAELARLTAPVEGEPSGDELYATYGDHGDTDTCMRRIYRLGVAHERARQPAQDRATDEELADLYAREYDAQAHQTRDPFSKSHSDCRRAAVAAVAAHVRGERCLIARAVGDQLIDSVSIDRVTGGRIRVRVVRRRDPIASPDGESVEAFCKRRSDVPSTLARLLGEVSRG